MKRLISASLAVMMLSLTGCTQAGAADLSKDQVEVIIKEYLMEHPEIIREALIELELREERQAFDLVKDRMYDDVRDARVGPKDAKVTIVEFFDYNCGYCKKSTEWLQETIEKHPTDVQVIFKELPILDRRTKTSKNAAKAALAADRQGKYLEMHFALMAERSLTSERLEALAEKAGLNIAQFKTDMADPEIETHIDETINLATEVPNLTGTPFFMIGDEYFAGANADRLEELLEKALKG